MHATPPPARHRPSHILLQSPPPQPHLQLLKGEAAAQALLHVVLDGLAVHQGAQLAGRGAGEDRLGLGNAGCSAGRVRARSVGSAPRSTSLRQRSRKTTPRGSWARAHLWAGTSRTHTTPPARARATSDSPFLRRRARAGWLNQVLTLNCHFFLKCWFGTTLLWRTILANHLRGTGDGRHSREHPLTAASPLLSARLQPVSLTCEAPMRAWKRDGLVGDIRYSRPGLLAVPRFLPRSPVLATSVDRPDHPPRFGNGSRPERS